MKDKVKRDKRERLSRIFWILWFVYLVISIIAFIGYNLNWIFCQFSASTFKDCYDVFNSNWIFWFPIIIAFIFGAEALYFDKNFIGKKTSHNKITNKIMAIISSACITIMSGGVISTVFAGIAWLIRYHPIALIIIFLIIIIVWIWIKINEWIDKRL